MLINLFIIALLLKEVLKVLMQKLLMSGRPETVLNPKVMPLILEQLRYGYGACHIEQIFRKNKFTISYRQIEKVLLRNGLVKPNIKKQK